MNGIKRTKGKIEKIKKETEDVLSLFIRTDEKIGYRPSQFVMASFKDLINNDTGKPLERAFSIASAPEEEHLMLTIKLHDNGTFTNHVFSKLKEGDDVNIKGPFGHFLYDPEKSDIVVLIAAGSGIAPMRGIMRHIELKGLDKDVHLFYTSRHKEDIIYKDYLKTIEEKKNFNLHLSLTRPGEEWTCGKGRICTEDITDICPPKSKTAYFICGKKDMVLDMKKKLIEKGSTEENVITEVW